MKGAAKVCTCLLMCKGCIYDPELNLGSFEDKQCKFQKLKADTRFPQSKICKAKSKCLLFKGLFDAPSHLHVNCIFFLLGFAQNGLFTV